MSVFGTFLEESYDEYIDGDLLNEGLFLHSKEAKELKTKVIEICKKYNPSRKGFAKAFVNNIKSAGRPSQSLIDNVERDIAKLFDNTYFTGVIIKSMDYYDGYGNYIHYEYYAVSCFAIKNTLCIQFTMAVSGIGFGYPAIADCDISESNITKDDVAVIIDILNNSRCDSGEVSISTKKNTITISNGTARYRKDLFNELYETLARDLSDRFEVSNAKLFSIINLVKR